MTLLVAERGEDRAMGRGCWNNQGSAEQPGVELRGNLVDGGNPESTGGRQKLEFAQTQKICE